MAKEGLLIERMSRWLFGADLHSVIFALIFEGRFAPICSARSALPSSIVRV